MRVVPVPNGAFDAPTTPPADPAPVALDEDEQLLDEYPLVLVTWHDAFFDFDQAAPEDCRPDYLVRTVGYLVHEGPRFVSIAQEILPDGDGFRAVTHIPRSIVEDVVMLHPEPTSMAAGETG
jgi:hypothetical protein